MQALELSGDHQSLIMVISKKKKVLFCLQNSQHPTFQLETRVYEQFVERPVFFNYAIKDWLLSVSH